MNPSLPPASKNDRFSLRDKVILLTGGAGLYGRGLAADLAAAGATLIVASRTLSACQRVADEETARGHTVYAECYDQGDETSIAALFERILARFSRVDGLVNNSVARTMKSATDTAGWEESLKINATGIFLMHRYFGQQMVTQGGGSIVNIGSIYGMVGPTLAFYEGTTMGTGVPDYYFNKSGMVNLSRFYAAQFGSGGVRVNCISPGGFFNNQPESFVDRYTESTFLGRMGQEADLGGAVIFLLSEASLYITGINLPVDGGFTAH